MAKSQQVEETRKPVAGALAIPEHMRGDAGKGTEKFESGSYEFPRLALLQGLSEQLQVYDGVKSGEFFHTLAERSLGTHLTIVPLHISTRYILWSPRPPIDAGGILARADDGVHWMPADAEFTVKIDKKGTQVVWKTKKTVTESGLDQWGSYDRDDPKSPPAATQVYFIVVALPDYPELSPVALLLQRGSIKPARSLRGKLKITAAPIYGMRFTMSSFVDGDANQQFNNYRFVAAGFVEDVDEYNSYKALYESFEKSGVQVRDLEAAQEDSPSGGASSSAEAARAAASEKAF